MLRRIDRVQLAVPDRQVVAKAWQILLGAEHDSDDRVECLGASRTRLRLGTGWVELLEPDGAGLVADAVGAKGAHLFAAGAATDDLNQLVARLQANGVDPDVEGGQAFLDAGHGLRVVVSPEEDLPAVGAIDELYEVTNLVADAEAAATSHAELFGLHPSFFEPISSTEYGYAGTLTLFHPDRLHRVEVIHPHASDKTMGRYFSRFGESLYMCFAECGDLRSVEARVREAGAGVTPVEDHTLFIHPQGLGGTMVGLSRRTYAWTWSGHPERVEANEHE